MKRLVIRPAFFVNSNSSRSEISNLLFGAHDKEVAQLPDYGMYLTRSSFSAGIPPVCRFTVCLSSP